MTSADEMDESSTTASVDEDFSAANSMATTNNKNLSVKGSLLKSLYSKLKQIDNQGRLIQEDDSRTLDDISDLQIVIDHENVAIVERFGNDVFSPITIRELADEKQVSEKTMLERVLNFIFSSERGKSLNLNLGAILREYQLTLAEVAEVRDYLINSSAIETPTIRSLLRDFCFLATELEILLAVIYLDPNESTVKAQFKAAATYIPIEAISHEEEEMYGKQFDEILDDLQAHRRAEMEPKLVGLDASIQQKMEETDMYCHSVDVRLERLREEINEMKMEMNDRRNERSRSIIEIVIEDDGPEPMDGGNEIVIDDDDLEEPTDGSNEIVIVDDDLEEPTDGSNEIVIVDEPMDNVKDATVNEVVIEDDPEPTNGGNNDATINDGEILPSAEEMSRSTTFAKFAAAHASDVVLPRRPSNHPELVLPSSPPPSPIVAPSTATATMPKPPRDPRLFKNEPYSTSFADESSMAPPGASESSEMDDVIVSYPHRRPCDIQFGPDSSTIPLRTEKPVCIPAPKVDEICLAALPGTHEWASAKVLGSTSTGHLRVDFENDDGVALIYDHQLAFASPPSWYLHVGDRAVAQFDTKRRMPYGRASGPWMAAIVAEQPSMSRNNGRYLVFNIDGDARYVNYTDIRCVWGKERNCQIFLNDVYNPTVANYLKKLLDNLPEKALVRLKLTDEVKFLDDGATVRKCTVVETDYCMAKLRMPDATSEEWVYRGDWRFFRQNFPQHRGSIAGAAASSRYDHPAHKSITNSGACAQSSSATNFGRRHHSRRSGPEVEFVGGSDDDEDADQTENLSRKVPTARKRTAAAGSSSSTSSPGASTTSRARIRIRSNLHVNSEYPIIGRENMEVYRRTIDRQCPSSIDTSGEGASASSGIDGGGRPRRNPSRAPRQCDETCLGENHDAQYHKNENPMAIPLVCGWQRIVEKTRTSTRVVYVPPCGHDTRRLMHEIQLNEFLVRTKCRLTVDLFEFDPDFDPYESIRVIEPFVRIEDFTNGRENVRIECVNGYSHEEPNFPDYASARYTTDPTVKLDEAKEFLSGCDCKDNCAESKTCRCQRLTAIQAQTSRVLKPIGYKYRRLPDGQILTGIFECNANCNCNARCQNRVAQQPMLARMQLFRTKDKGWGVRTVDAIPKGAFICTYAGNLMSDDVANEVGNAQGDEFFADLDFIQRCEDVKEIDEDFESADVARAAESAKRRKGDSNENEHSGAGASANVDEGPSDLRAVSPTIPDYNRRPWIMSEYLGEECVFALDAKFRGNIGRYMNHSCDPNVFVQSVFVDTHDPRLPWIAFFANQEIKAGEELCWDYHYEPMDDRATACNCGAKNCRKRLL